MNNKLELEIEGIDKRVDISDDGSFSTKIEIFKGKSAVIESERLNIPL